MTESRPPYQAAGPNRDNYGPDGYDENGLDPWGMSRAEKDSLFAKLARRFEEQPDSMAALLVEYRRQEGMSQERLLAKLEITPEQYSHLALCLVPDAGAQFAADLNTIVAASGANIAQLADICRQVYAMRDFSRRPPVGSGTQNEPKGAPAKVYSMRASAARDRMLYTKAVREEGVDYSADANAPTAAPAPLAAEAPPAPKRESKEDTASSAAEGADTPGSAESNDEPSAKE